MILYTAVKRLLYVPTDIKVLGKGSLVSHYPLDEGDHTSLALRYLVYEHKSFLGNKWATEDIRHRLS